MSTQYGGFTHRLLRRFPTHLAARRSFFCVTWGITTLLNKSIAVWLFVSLSDSLSDRTCGSGRFSDSELDTSGGISCNVQRRNTSRNTLPIPHLWCSIANLMILLCSTRSRDSIAKRRNTSRNKLPIPHLWCSIANLMTLLCSTRLRDSIAIIEHLFGIAFQTNPLGGEPQDATTLWWLNYAFQQLQTVDALVSFFGLVFVHVCCFCVSIFSRNDVITTYFDLL